MVKNRTFFVLLVCFVLSLVAFNFITFYFLGIPLSPVVMTGKGIDTAIVQLYIEGDTVTITIHSPENTTYDNNTYECVAGFPKCSDYRYYLDLNASADFVLEDSDDWRYSLYDLRHGVYIKKNMLFTVNTSMPFVRWGNLLTVFAEQESADWVSQSVVFTIEVPNSSPLISDFSEKIFVCEGEHVQDSSDSYFNVIDVDEETFSDDSAWVSPQESFFDINYLGEGANNSVNRFQIVSGDFDKSRLRNHVKTVSVWDPTNRIASNTTNITVIEINHAPVIENELRLETTDIYMTGVDSVFSHEYSVSDTEVDFREGSLTFNLTTDGLDFDINSSTGEMTYVPQEGDQGKTYSLRACVTDSALESVHENFSICFDKGYTSDSLSDCDDFLLTITEENRPPSIDSYFPLNLSFTVLGTDTISFNASVSDDDTVNAYPPIDWYVDDVLVESVENVPSDSFSYSFGCGVSGIHSVMVITNDSLATDSVTWNITVTNVACPVEKTGGSSGGGGGTSLDGYCNEQWNCDGWGLCQNAERSFRAGVLSPEDYSATRDLCAQNQYDDRFCGFQITECFDMAMCNNTEIRVPKPSESRVCYFTENPNCIDGITNCHDGDCELLVDCGGPCDPCPTCSDGKRNQGEDGVDCGGPCPYACEPENPLGIISIALILLSIILLAIVIFIVIKLMSILRYRFLLGKKKKKKDKR